MPHARVLSWILENKTSPLVVKLNICLVSREQFCFNSKKCPEKCETREKLKWLTIELEVERG
jgi:hypothetical protein